MNPDENLITPVELREYEAEITEQAEKYVEDAIETFTKNIKAAATKAVHELIIKERARAVEIIEDYFGSNGMTEEISKLIMDKPVDNVQF